MRDFSFRRLIGFPPTPPSDPTADWPRWRRCAPPFVNDPREALDRLKSNIAAATAYEPALAATLANAGILEVVEGIEANLDVDFVRLAGEIRSGGRVDEEALARSGRTKPRVFLTSRMSDEGVEFRVSSTARPSMDGSGVSSDWKLRHVEGKVHPIGMSGRVALIPKAGALSDYALIGLQDPSPDADPTGYKTFVIRHCREDLCALVEQSWKGCKVALGEEFEVVEVDVPVTGTSKERFGRQCLEIDTPENRRSRAYALLAHMRRDPASLVLGIEATPKFRERARVVAHALRQAGIDDAMPRNQGEWTERIAAALDLTKPGWRDKAPAAVPLTLPDAPTPTESRHPERVRPGVDAESGPDMDRGHVAYSTVADEERRALEDIDAQIAALQERRASLSAEYSERKEKALLGIQAANSDIAEHVEARDGEPSIPAP